MLPFVMQGDNITVVVDNRPHTVNRTHPTYQRLVDAIKAGDWDTVREVIDPKQVVLNWAQGNVSIQGDQLYWQGEPFSGALSQRMIDMLREGFDIQPMAQFMTNLMQNPSKRAVDELYGFLEKNSLPITPDGHFLAYKRVRADYRDCHSGTMDNSPGTVVEMPRNQVDDNKDNTCSAGLHFCSQEYLQSFGGDRTVIVKINPRDVVSIPTDYNNSKGRACRYEVISELAVSEDRAFDRPVQSQANRPVKQGSSAFYAGYTDGYGSYSYRDYAYTSARSRQDYDEGYSKGRDHLRQGLSARYEYRAENLHLY